MRTAVSNIAWSEDSDSAVATRLVNDGTTFIEIAPTKKWDDPTVVSRDEARKYREEWEERGMEIVAFQSLLFNRPDLRIFESETNRHETSEYLKRFLRLAGWMGARRLVFGSPKNRQVGSLDQGAANDIATAFFDELGTEAANNGVILCLEPNAPQYACDFVTNALEGDALVRRVGNKGFRLHLDTACMALADDDFKEAIVRSGDILTHFHASSPMLDDVIDRPDVPHRRAAEALRAVSYGGYVSLEMKPDPAADPVKRAARAAEFVRSVYA